MLNPTILLTLQPAMPPSRPEMMIEHQTASPRIELIKRHADRVAAAYETGIAAWIEGLRKGRETVEGIAPRQAMSERELAYASQAIEDVEYAAELRALSLRRFRKRAARDINHWFSMDPALGAIVRSLCDRLAAADEAAIEAYLDHALYMHAFRAERSAGARGGPVFDDPGALDAYLKAAFA